jgi:hypothetical protein
MSVAESRQPPVLVIVGVSGCGNATSQARSSVDCA